MGIMGIIGMIVVGFIIGVLARWFYPGTVAMGFWMTAALGVAGSLIGGVITSFLWKAPDGKFHRAGWIMSILGAMILIWGYLNFGK
ncbi:MAG TPA: GlsB/YeaQ/YmgE family stress response membrane protein [Casimicrobiaceae bacterium]|nr:GlsB/YeaQ/YmgE family stress response membrane protein [Casimicrobiaceae bacterium]